jgi:hypothetical protein
MLFSVDLHTACEFNINSNYYHLKRILGMLVFRGNKKITFLQAQQFFHSSSMRKWKKTSNVNIYWVDQSIYQLLSMCLILIQIHVHSFVTYVTQKKSLCLPESWFPHLRSGFYSWTPSSWWEEIAQFICRTGTKPGYIECPVNVIYLLSMTYLSKHSFLNVF